jgi:hypothetical protein
VFIKRLTSNYWHSGLFFWGISIRYQSDPIEPLVSIKRRQFMRSPGLCVGGIRLIYRSRHSPTKFIKSTVFRPEIFIYTHSIYTDSTSACIHISCLIFPYIIFRNISIYRVLYVVWSNKMALFYFIISIFQSKVSFNSSKTVFII